MAVYPIIPAETDFGGHEFEYESHTDLFRCVRCRQYEGGGHRLRHRRDHGLSRTAQPSRVSRKRYPSLGQTAAVGFPGGQP